LRAYMTEVMKYWVREFKIDGFRADVAGFVPIEFWENLREELETIRPVFMLAEWESRDLHKKAFDMTYAWSLYDRLRKVVSGKEGLSPLIEYIAFDVNSFPPEAYRMTFTDNHDKNSWNGTARSNFGEALEAAIVLTCTINGMPLVYSGQEAGLNRSLSFFEKDQIEWKEHPHWELFRKLFALKKRNQALWNGSRGGQMMRINNNHPEQVLSFVREKNGSSVVVIINFSNEILNVNLDADFLIGNYSDVFMNQNINIKKDIDLLIEPWGYRVMEKIAG
jgi:cyclomaltodextrinase / maltogenic alpha-amylase / neopullulanase